MANVLIIGYTDNFINILQEHLEMNNYLIRRINLYLDELNSIVKSKDPKIINIELKNFHDLTIETMDFEPQIVLYFPLELIYSIESPSEYFEIIHVELIEHLLEIIQVINCKLYFVDIIPKGKINLNNINQMEFDLIRNKRTDLLHSNSKSDSFTIDVSNNSTEQCIDDIIKLLR